MIQRLFFAVWPDASTRTQLNTLAEQLGQDYPARWIHPSRYHLTLCFLDTRDHFPPALIARALQAAANMQIPAFVWRPDCVSSFRVQRPPCVIRASKTSPLLQHLHETLRDALAARDIPVANTRRYVPHVTLGYGRGRIMADRSLPAMDFPVDSFVLLHSMRGENRYRELGRWPLTSLSGGSASQRFDQG